MKKLNNISQNTLLSMFEQNPEIKELSELEINDKMNLLSSVGCNDVQILNIISSNSLYLSKTNEEVIDLFNYMEYLGFKSINLLLDSNPYILNLEPFEIKEYIEKRISNGAVKEEIIYDLDSNPYLFSEM